MPSKLVERLLNDLHQIYCTGGRIELLEDRVWHQWLFDLGQPESRSQIRATAALLAGAVIRLPTQRLNKMISRMRDSGMLTGAPANLGSEVYSVVVVDKHAEQTVMRGKSARTRDIAFVLHHESLLTGTALEQPCEERDFIQHIGLVPESRKETAVAVARLIQDKLAAGFPHPTPHLFGMFRYHILTMIRDDKLELYTAADDKGILEGYLLQSFIFYRPEEKFWVAIDAVLGEAESI